MNRTETTEPTGQVSGGPATPYRRARHLALTWDDGGLRCLQADTGRVYRATVEVVGVLDAAGSGLSASEIATRAKVVTSMVHRLGEHGLLEAVTEQAEPADQVPAGEDDPPLHLWSTYELAVQRRFGLGRRRPHLDFSQAPPSLSDVPGERIPLLVPAVPRGAGVSFSGVLRARRSRRHFARTPLPLADLAELLVEAAGVQGVNARTGTTRRPYPSGGARHSLEIFVAAIDVAGLAPRCYYFDPLGALVPRTGTEAFTRRLARGLLPDADGRPQPARVPGAVLLVTSLFERTFWKYYDLGLTVVHKDVGCLYQTLYLQATALGLAGYAVGGGPEGEIARQLGLDPRRQGYVGAFVVGVPVEEEAVVEVGSAGRTGGPAAFEESDGD